MIAVVAFVVFALGAFGAVNVVVERVVRDAPWAWSLLVLVACTTAAMLSLVYLIET